jgi:hypothetical protein
VSLHVCATTCSRSDKYSVTRASRQDRSSRKRQCLRDASISLSLLPLIVKKLWAYVGASFKDHQYLMSYIPAGAATGSVCEPGAAGVVYYSERARSLVDSSQSSVTDRLPAEGGEMKMVSAREESVTREEGREARGSLVSGRGDHGRVELRVEVLAILAIQSCWLSPS